MPSFFSPGFRVAIATTSATLALALGSTACSSTSSSGCVSPPGPVPVASIQAPCGLTFASVTVSGPCQTGGTGVAPTVTGTGDGACTVSATFSNGARASGTVTFTPDGNVCETFTPTPATITLALVGSSACDAGAASDATAD